MKKPLENFAFIDGQNLNLGVQGLGWKLDFQKFRVYLQEKYAVKKAYYFIGYISEQKELYAALKESGFTLVFKPTLRDASGTVKGNCDAELVLQAMIDFKAYKKAVIVSGDGDFHCLVSYLQKHDKLERLLAPSHRNCSSLLLRALKNNIIFIEHSRSLLKYKKSPGKSGAMKGNPSTDRTAK